MANHFSRDSDYLWGRSSLIFVFYYPYSYYLVSADIAANEVEISYLSVSPSLSSLSPTFIQPIVCRAFPAGGPSRDSTATRPHSSFLFSTPPPMALACRYRLWCSRTKPKVMLGTGEKVSTERLWVKIRFWGVSGTEPWREAETGCLGRRHQSQVKATRTAGLKQKPHNRKVVETKARTGWTKKHG